MKHIVRDLKINNWKKEEVVIACKTYKQNGLKS